MDRDVVKYVFVFKYADFVYLYFNNYSMMYLYLSVEFGVFDQIQFQIHITKNDFMNVKINKKCTIYIK